MNRAYKDVNLARVNAVMAVSVPCRTYNRACLTARQKGRMQNRDGKLLVIPGFGVVKGKVR